jgi:hypothetical protein
MSRLSCGVCLIAFITFAAPRGAHGQDKYKTYQEAYNAGVKSVNGGNLAAAREPLEAAVKLAKTDREKLEVQRTLMIPYRELQEIEPMQGAAEFIIANADLPAERP